MGIVAADILRRLDAERQTIAHEGEVLETDPPVTRLTSADGSHRVISYAELTEANADAVIDRELERHGGLDSSFEWKVYGHDPLPDLKDRLARRGFAIGTLEVVLALDLSSPPDWLHGSDPAGEAAPALRVERVETLEQTEIFRRVAEEVFGGDWSFTTAQLAAGIAAGSHGHRGYVGYVGAEPVSVGRLYFHPASWFGGLYGGGTRAAFRGGGVYRAVVAARGRDAIAAGARYLLVDALPTSCPILLRMGFEPVGQTWACVME